MIQSLNWPSVCLSRCVCVCVVCVSLCTSTLYSVLGYVCPAAKLIIYHVIDCLLSVSVKEEEQEQVASTLIQDAHEN